jgi:hypothetical protein
VLGRLRIVHAALVASLFAASLTLTGCDPLGIGKMADAIEKTIDEMGPELEAWRGTLQALPDELAKFEDDVDKDAKELATSTTKQVASLTTQAIELTNAKVQDRIAQAGTEFRCNADFLKESVRAELRYLADKLRFWEKKKPPPVPPVHKNCWIAPDTLSLYPTNDGQWQVDPVNMSTKGIIRLYGYAYRAEALPTVTLQDSTGTQVRPASVVPAYVTRYQINLDISTETFAGFQPGSRLVLDWPDDPGDSTTINLVSNPPAKLQIVNTELTPTEPKAGYDSVYLKVTVKNTGGTNSGPFTVTWVWDPEAKRISTRSYDGVLRPDELAEIGLGPNVYERSGDIPSFVSVDGGHSAQLPLRVLPGPPPRAGELSTGDDCDAIHYDVIPAAVPLGEVEFVLKPGFKINWWKGVFVPVTQGADVVTGVVPGLGMPALMSPDNRTIIAFNSFGKLEGGYRGFTMQDGTEASGRIALADLDRNRALQFGKAKGFGNKTTLPFKWHALSADVIDPLDGSKVILTWNRDGC